MPKEAPTVSSIDRSHNPRIHRCHSPFPSAPARVQIAWRRGSPSSLTPAQPQVLGVNSSANHIGTHVDPESDSTSDQSHTIIRLGGNRGEALTTDRVLLGRRPLKAAHGQLPEGSAPYGRGMLVSERDTGPTVQGAVKRDHASAPLAAHTNRHSCLGRDSQIERRHRQLLQEKDAHIEELKSRIHCLETSERRLKAQKLESSDRFANKDAELGEVTRALQVAEETLDEKENVTRGLIGEVHHYQGWWLNEYYCLKVALKLAQNQNDKGVKAMKESSHARFMKWSGSHQS